MEESLINYKILNITIMIYKCKYNFRSCQHHHHRHHREHHHDHCLQQDTIVLIPLTRKSLKLARALLRYISMLFRLIYRGPWKYWPRWSSWTNQDSVLKYTKEFKDPLHRMVEYFEVSVSVICWMSSQDWIACMRPKLMSGHIDKSLVNSAVKRNTAPQPKFTLLVYQSTGWDG